LKTISGGGLYLGLNAAAIGAQGCHPGPGLDNAALVALAAYQQPGKRNTAVPCRATFSARAFSLFKRKQIGISNPLFQ
jgi:hypothetical protein